MGIISQSFGGLAALKRPKKVRAKRVRIYSGSKNKNKNGIRKCILL